MDHAIISTAHIEQAAQIAALRFSDVNAACPYPFGTSAGQAFKAAFEQARQAIAATVPALCGCDLDLCQQELDTGRCMACGGAVLA